MKQNRNQFLSVVRATALKRQIFIRKFQSQKLDFTFMTDGWLTQAWVLASVHCCQSISTTKRLRGHTLKLVKHRSTLEVRRNFFTERLINRWNNLDHQALDVDSVNCFKNHLHLHRLRNTRMGFFRGLTPD